MFVILLYYRDTYVNIKYFTLSALQFIDHSYDIYFTILLYIYMHQIMDKMYSKSIYLL